MSYIGLGVKLAFLCMTNRFVTGGDITESYTKISPEYENMYLDTMHKYNDMLLRYGELDSGRHLRILDLGGGTGYNCRVLKGMYPDVRIDLVDGSDGMLREAEKAGISVHKSDMLEYVRNCRKHYDLIVCSWALIYSAPRKVIRQCFRILENGGLLKVIVNKRDTLPEIRRIYPRLLSRHVPEVKKVMLELATPKSRKEFESWFGRGFTCCMVKDGKQKFRFQTKQEAVSFVTSTGALAGYDVMLDLHKEGIKKDMACLLDRPEITHSFVCGVYRKEI